MNNITLTITPQRTAVLAGHRTELYALVCAQAPDLPEDPGGKRPPLNLALVLDRSGSMSGQPMDEARRCAHYMVDQLGPEDRMALVAYDEKIDVLAQSALVVNKTRLHHAIDELYARGSTALFDGWRTGAVQTLRGEANAKTISRVLLLSDGQANQGLTEVDQIAAHCADMAARGVSTSTYGLSTQFNEELMVAMARSGQGQSYYGQTAEDLMDPFQEEFSLLAATCARGLTLALEPHEGVGIEVLNDYLPTENGGWHLPDLAYGGEVWAAVKLTLLEARVSHATDEPLTLLQAKVAYRTNGAIENGVIQAGLQLPALPLDAWQTLATDEKVTARLQELRTAAMAGDWRRVKTLLASAEQEAANNPWLESALASLRRYAEAHDEARLSKEAAYSAYRLSSRMASPEEDSAEYREDEEAVKRMYLRRKRELGRRMGKEKWRLSDIWRKSS